MNIEKIKLDPNILNYKVYGFKDYKGDTHHITIAVIFDETLCGITYLKIGVAIQNPKDEHIEIIGANRAAKNARKGNVWVSAMFKGIQNLAPAIVENEWNFVKDNINLFIPGYKDEERKYLKKQYEEDMELVDRI